MIKSLKLVISVLLACLVAAAGLALTYNATAPRIAEQNRLAEERALQAVQPGADAFEAVEDEALLGIADAAADPTDFKALFRATEGGTHVGWAVKLASRGYAGPIQLVIGLDTSGLVTGVSILAMKETPGLGTKIETEEWFLEQFLTLPAGFTDADVRKLDSIAGATRSVDGVRNGVAAAGRIFVEVLAELEGGAQ